MARADGRAPSPTAPPSRSTASIRCSSSTPSGSTGKPKGILHTTGRLPARRVDDAPSGSSTSSDDDIYWCTADIGWVTGHSYVVYGPLANGATVVMYEGAPNSPAGGPLLGDHREVPRHHLLHRADRDPRLHQVGRPAWPKKHDLSSLRLLGTVGEPINPEAWMWYHEVIGGEPLPDRRYLVADGNRRDHDRAAARRDRRPSPAAATQAVARHRSPTSSTKQGKPVPAEPGRLARHPQALAGDAAHASTATTSAIKQQYWSKFPGMLLHRRRRPPRRGRLLLDHGPRRRRAQRRRPPPQHDGSRKRPGQSSDGRRGRGRRPAGRDQGRGDLLLRHAQAAATRRATR